MKGGWGGGGGRNVCLLVGCLTTQQQASVSQGRICSDNCTCCHTRALEADALPLGQRGGGGGGGGGEKERRITKRVQIKTEGEREVITSLCDYCGLFANAKWKEARLLGVEIRLFFLK